MSWRVVVVAVVAVTAGCASAGGLGGGSPTEAMTPAPVPTLSPTPDDPRADIAPGVNSSGIYDTEVLISHHMSALIGTSYVWERHQRRSYRTENRTFWSNSSQRFVVENATTYTRNSSSIELGIQDRERYPRHYREYADNRYRYASWSPSSESQHIYDRVRVTNMSRQFARLPTRSIRRFLDLDDERVVRISSADDRALYRIEGTRSDLSLYSNVRNYTARAVVREDGLVRSFHVSFQTTRGNRTVTITHSSRYTRIGNATVTEPSWVSDARNRLEVTPTRNGTGTGN